MTFVYRHSSLSCRCSPIVIVRLLVDGDSDPSKRLIVEGCWVMCGQAIVVSSTSSSSIRSLATIAVYCCFSSLSDDRSSLLGSRSSSSFIRSFARIATVHCVSLSEDDRSVSCVLRSSIVRGRLGFVSRRPSSLVCRRLSLVVCCRRSFAHSFSLGHCRYSFAC